MAGWFGQLHVARFNPDGTAVALSLFVPAAEAEECDFWLCTPADHGANADDFFGPAAA